MGINKTKILKAILKGDPTRQLDELYTYEYPKIKNYVLKNSGNEHDALDIFQEAVMVFFTYVKQGRFKEEYDIGAFMFVVARNQWRKKNRSSVDEVELKPDYHGYALSENPYDQIFNSEKKIILEKMMSELGQNCKDILSAVLYEKLSMKEIADKYDYASVTTAKTRHYKCKQRLIKLVKGNKYIENEIRYN